MDRMIRARAVLAELDALGLTIEYVEVVAAAYKPGTAATYRSAWRVLTDLLGERPLNTMTADVVVVDSRMIAPAAGRHGATSVGM